MRNRSDKRLWLGAGLAVGLAGLSGGASAQVAASSCASAVLDYQSALSPNADGPPFSAAHVLSSQPACFGGSAANAQVQINATSFAQASAISGALASRFQGSAGPGTQLASGTRSLAAGDAGRGFNVWGSLDNSDSRQSYLNDSSDNIRNNAKVLNSVIGADYAVASYLVVGVSAAFDRGDLSSQNISTAEDSFKSTSKGYVIAPYVGYQISKELALDASAGVGRGKQYSSGEVSAESDRWFGAANLSYNQWFGNLQFTGKLSYLHGEEKYGDIKLAGTTVDGSSAKNAIDQARLGVQAGYWVNGFMPYVGLAWKNDLHRVATADENIDVIGRTGLVWTVGLNFFSLPSGLSAGVAYSQEERRSNQNSNNLLANVNVRF